MHVYILVDKEYHDVSNKAPKKKPSTFGHNSVRISISFGHNSVLRIFHFIWSRQCAFPFHLVTTVCAHFHFDDFARLQVISLVSNLAKITK